MKLLSKYKSSSVVRNFSILTVSNFLIQAISVLASIRIARVLSPDVFGQYSIVFVQAGIVGIFASLGLRLIIIRIVARQPERSNQLLFTSAILRVAAIIIVAVFFVIYNRFIVRQYTGFILALMIIQIISTTFWDTIEAVLFGHEKMDTSGIINFAFTLVWVAAIFCTPGRYLNLNLLVLFVVSNQALKSLSYFIIARRTGCFQGTIKYHEITISIKELLPQSMPYYWLALFTMVSSQVPILFLQFLSNNSEVAFFNVGYKILSPFQMMLNVVLTALFPNIAKLFVNDVPTFNKRMRQALIFFITIGIIGAFVISLFRTEIISILFGPKYILSADAMAYQCWYTVLYALFCLIGTVLGALNRQKLLAILSTFNAILATPILWIGAHYGAEGLAVAFVAGAIVNMTYTWHYFQKYLPKKIDIKYSLTLFFAVISSIFISRMIPTGFPLLKVILLCLFIAITSCFYKSIKSKYNYLVGVNQ